MQNGSGALNSKGFFRFTEWGLVLDARNLVTDVALERLSDLLGNCLLCFGAELVADHPVACLFLSRPDPCQRLNPASWTFQTPMLSGF